MGYPHRGHGENKYVVRLYEYDDDYTVDIDADSMERAAEDACEYWRTRSHWSGGPPMGGVECEVRHAGHEEWQRINVDVRYEPVYHGYRPR